MRLPTLPLAALFVLPAVPPTAIPSVPITIGVSLDAAELFTSNGCSGFREAMFFSCCFVHDFAYWAGGTWDERGRADHALRDCLVQVSHNHVLAYVAYALVRMTTFSGAGITFGGAAAGEEQTGKLYAPLTDDQRRLIAAERHRICAGLTLDPARKRYFVDESGAQDRIRQLRAADARQLCGPELPAPTPRSTSR